ncbi:MAG: hypothetical protein LBV76_01750 [Deltaproteobacteria bacterium]|nr:hypothetical protein [Deltaproteobacteria bacterium]
MRISEEGVKEVIELELNAEEQNAMQASVTSLRSKLEELDKIL